MSNEENGVKNAGFVSVAVFLVDRAFGGPEEGGWWYDCGEPANEPELIIKTRYFLDKKDAKPYRDELQNELAALNAGRPPISSVLSEGRYEAMLCNGHPKAWPERRPAYS